MATGPGLGALIPVAMTLAGIVTMLRARSRRRAGQKTVDEDFEQRRAATLETERRMAAYLAGRDTGHRQALPEDDNGQETRR